MAMVYLTKHNENIYNAENIQNQSPKQHGQSRGKSGVRPSSMYISKFRPLVKQEEQTRKNDHKSMGHANTPLSSPSDYLKKGAGIRCKSSTEHKCIRKDMPPIPRHNEVPRKPPATGYQKESTASRQMLKSAPHTAQHRPRYADTRYGSAHDLLASGLMPRYVFSPNFGKVPDYILKQKARSGARDRQLKDDDNTSKSGVDPRKGGQSGVMYLSQDERQSLLSGLKTNWEKLQKRYQGLSVLTDTEPKKATKANLERQLKQLEQDILLLESNPHIYVCDNN